MGKQSGQQGSTPLNLYEGARSEYLARYLLSALGPCALVPRPEDHGVDLQCGLARRVGQRGLIEHYFLVQVKSSGHHDIVYKGDAIDWLLMHRYPLFVCVIDKNGGKASLYQTLILGEFAAKRSSTLTSITLKPGGTFDQAFGRVEANGDVVLYLGPPIIELTPELVADKAKLASTSAALRSWLELEADNLLRKHLGFSLVAFPKKAFKIGERVDEVQYRFSFDAEGLYDEGTRVNSVLERSILDHLAAVLVMAAMAGGKDNLRRAIKDIGCVVRAMGALDPKQAAGLQMVSNMLCSYFNAVAEQGDGADVGPVSPDRG